MLLYRCVLPSLPPISATAAPMHRFPLPAIKATVDSRLYRRLLNNAGPAVASLRPSTRRPISRTSLSPHRIRSALSLVLPAAVADAAATRPLAPLQTL